jgi:hypothetical protein
MNIEAITFQVFWVPDGAASERMGAVAWVALPKEMPAFGSKEFRKMTIKMYFRKSFFQQSYDRAAMAVAHELSHIILESIGHPLRRCEKAVDLTAMLLGFSRVCELACHKEQRVGNTINISTVGYLTQDEVAHAIRLLTGKQPQTKDGPVYTEIYRPRPRARVRRLSWSIPRSKIVALSAVLIVLIVASTIYKLARLHQTLLREQRLIEAHLPRAINSAITLVRVRLELTNLTLVYQISAPSSMVHLSALEANERMRLCDEGFSTYGQEYLDESNKLIGQFAIASCP